MFMVLTCLDTFHWLQFDDFTPRKTEQTFVICCKTLDCDNMTGILHSRYGQTLGSSLARFLLLPNKFHNLALICDNIVRTCPSLYKPIVEHNTKSRVKYPDELLVEDFDDGRKLGSLGRLQNQVLAFQLQLHLVRRKDLDWQHLCKTAPTQTSVNIVVVASDFREDKLAFDN